MEADKQSKKILIVEDEPKLAALLADYLMAAHYEVELVADGNKAIPSFKSSQADLIILDLTLPGRDGLDICRELRSFTQVPVIMVTARVEEIDRLIGLELGADDYICKPFSPREVVARVRTVLRRVQHQSQPEPLKAGGFHIDEDQHRAFFDNQLLELTPVEFRLLKILTDAPGLVFSRQQLLDKTYVDHRIVTERTIDTHIKNLRRKLEEIRPEQELIQSIYGVGYRLELP